LAICFALFLMKFPQTVPCNWC